jgi:hypothetical protein
MRVRTRLLLLARGIKYDEPGQFVGGCRRDDFPAEPPPGQERQPPAMIEMGMRQQYKINAGRIEAKIAAIFFGDLAGTLIEAAVDQHPAAGAFDEVARTRHVAVCPMK